MRREEAVQYLLSKPGAWEDHPFGPEPAVLKASSKMFALVAGGLTDGEPLQLSLKCDPETALMLRQEFEAVKPGYHLNKTHWNTVTVDGTVPEKDLIWMMDHSYELVVRGLTRAERSAIGL